MYGYKAYLTPAMFSDCFGRAIMIPSVADAKDGFWINTDNEFTRGEDATFWIPPAQIKYVEKIAGETYFASKEKDKAL